MKIAVFGSGYVGTVTGLCFADLGNELIGVDVDEQRVRKLNDGDPVIYERGLQEVLRRNLQAGRVRYTTDAREAVQHADVIFICVGTPPRFNGEADLQYVVEAAQAIGCHMNGYKVIVNKSTVPVGTYDVVRRAVREAQPGEEIDFDVVSNPEFLREGQALRDFQEPDRVVLGTSSERAKEMMEQLYRPVAKVSDGGLFFTTVASAELIKYASNAMLATRVSFMNELSHLCEVVGADIDDVGEAVGMDSRIGPHFLNAGCGYGGSCFPKDVKALAQLMEQHGLTSNLLRAVDYINDRQKRTVVHKLKKVYPSLEGKRVAIWGLAFKPGTDDMREATAVTVIEQLLREYATVVAYDPEALDNARELFGDRVEFVSDPYAAVKDADALLVLTEWQEFRQPDVDKLKSLMHACVVVDGRNILSRREMERGGFTYLSYGRLFPLGD